MDRAAYDREMLRLINEFGVAIQGVGGSEEEPPFTYTVGLAAHDHPEFILFGVPFEIGKAVLNDISSHVLTKTMTFTHGDTVTDLVEGFPVRLVEVVDTTRHLTTANRIYSTGAGSSIRALQIVFPDAEGRWPWEPESKVADFPLLGMNIDGGPIKVIPHS